MLSKPILAVLIIAIVVVVAAGIYAGTNHINPNSQNNSSVIVPSTDNNTIQNNSSANNINNTGQSMISTSEAQKIALKYIEEPNATAGTPKLEEDNGEQVYHVPVVMNGKTVGYIYINAYTGANVGGAGGA